MIVVSVVLVGYDDVEATLEQLAGVSGVSVSPGTNGASVLDVQVTQGGDIRRHLANAIVSNGWGLLEMRRLKMSLEDIFLELTTQDETAAPSEIDTKEAPDGDVGAMTPPEAADG